MAAHVWCRGTVKGVLVEIEGAGAGILTDVRWFVMVWNNDLFFDADRELCLLSSNSAPVLFKTLLEPRCSGTTHTCRSFYASVHVRSG